MFMMDFLSKAAICLKLGFLLHGMHDAACGMRQTRHISFLCEHDSFYLLCVIRYAVWQNELLHVAIHAANLYESM